MSELPVGDELDILSGLGNGYDTSKSGEKPVLIGGGAGVPPMYMLCKKLVAEGKKVTVILGFNSEKEVFGIDEFKATGVEVHVTTVDGSVGTLPISGSLIGMKSKHTKAAANTARAM